MIARTAHARNFSDLARYLEQDKDEPGHSRAAWWSAYNLPTSDIPSAARWMERTAERNRLVQRPAYHLFVSIAPQEDARPARMREAAERLLRRLRFGEHQAVAVGHEDRRHPHLHVAVNRVHPVTLRAWDVTRDWPRIERALRRIEQEMGFRPTPGRLAPTPDGRWCDNARAMPVGARRFELREREKADRARAAGLVYTPRPSFLRYAREHFAPAVREAGGWADLEAAAARLGLTLQQTHRGLLVTDGTHGAAISRVAEGASLRRLTREFGEDHVGYLARTRGPGGDAPAAGRGGAGEAARTAGAPPGAGAGTQLGPARQAQASGRVFAAEPAELRGRGAPAHPARAGGGDGDLGRGGGHPHAAGPGGGDAPVGGEHPGHGADRADGALGRGDGGVPDGAAGRVDAGGAGDRGGADRLGPGEGGRTGEVARGEHAGGSESHRGSAARAGALGGGADAADLPARDPARGGHGDPDPARGAAPLPLLGDEAERRGGVEPRNGAHPDRRGGVAEGAGGDPARLAVGPPAGRVGPFRVERAPGGWAVVHEPSARCWTLAREEAAQRFASRGNAAAAEPARVERVIRGLDRETARASHRELVARNAACDLLDHAAAHCFLDPVAATDVVRWNRLRGQGGRVRAILEDGPAAFGEMRVGREIPEVWASLPEPRHEHVPAWSGFREAVGVWLDVQDGAPWTPPVEFPPAPAAPVVTRSKAQVVAPQLQPPFERALSARADEWTPRPRERRPGLSR